MTPTTTPPPDHLAVAEARRALDALADAEAQVDKTKVDIETGLVTIYATAHMVHQGQIVEPGDEVSWLPLHARHQVLLHGNATTTKPSETKR